MSSEQELEAVLKKKYVLLFMSIFLIMYKSIVTKSKIPIFMTNVI